MRPLLAGLLLLSLSACRGAVSARGMRALGPWSDRDVALESAASEEGDRVAWARVGAAEAMKEAGLAYSKDPVPGALVIRVRELRPDEGRQTLLASPAGFAADRAAVVAAGAASAASKVTTGKARDAAGVVLLGAGAAELVKNAVRVRIALELFAPERERPIGGVVWEGYRNLDEQGEAEKAGREAGAVLAEEIASQRDRWVDRRAASERLFLTATPLLLEPGEAVVSLDEGLLLHAAAGIKPWLQLDLAAGGVPVATAGGLAHTLRNGATAMGVFALGFKVRLADELPLWPGVAVSYERVSLWSGALGTGRIALLGHVVDAANPEASPRVGLNVVTLALSKHPTDWLQVGAGAVLVDNHPLLGSGTPVTDADGTNARSRLPTQLLPYANLEARAGEHFRFVGEYLAAPGADAIVLGLRSLLFSGRRFGELRAPGWRLRLDTAAIFTSRETAGGSELAVLPWLGVAVYPR
ncbi:MAG TPA: hypothetical protein VLT61_04190 [Anaeromyxobacteraceae bacterium]|nr:hypothetical protein [Anaeromyxobacteraceae bacterium]